MPRQNRAARGPQSGNEMQWVVEFHPEFSREVHGFSDSVRREIYSLVGLLRKLGPQLGRP